MGIKKVLIPLDLLKQIAELLCCWDSSSYDGAVRRSHYNAMKALLNKTQSIALHNSYSKKVKATDAADRMDAKAEYIKLKWQQERYDYEF